MFNWIKSWFIKIIDFFGYILRICTKEPTYLDDLPDDILQTIANYLSISDIKNVLQIINRENRLEYIVPEYKILNDKYPYAWKLLELNEPDWNMKYPHLPVNRKILLNQLIKLEEKQEKYDINSHEHMLLSNGVDYIFKGGRLYLLSCSVIFNLSEGAKLIIDKRCSEQPNYNYKHESFNFEQACLRNHIEVIEVFLENQVKLSHSSISILFSKACKNGHIELIKLFIKYDYISLDKKHLVGFCRALENKQREIIQFFLSFDKFVVLISSFNSDLLEEAYQLINE